MPSNLIWKFNWLRPIYNMQLLKETLAKERPPIPAHCDPCLPKYITKHTYRDFLTSVVPVDGEKGVGGGCMKWGRLSACKEVVDGDLCGPREL